MKSGVDPFHSLYNKHNGDYTNSNFNFFQDNYDPGKLFPGSPVCNFEGKNIPTMIRYSEKGSITNTILTDILHTIDTLSIYKEYRENGAIPFLLVERKGKLN